MAKLGDEGDTYAANVTIRQAQPRILAVCAARFHKYAFVYRQCGVKTGSDTIRRGRRLFPPPFPPPFSVPPPLCNITTAPSPRRRRNVKIIGGAWESLEQKECRLKIYGQRLEDEVKQIPEPEQFGSLRELHYMLFLHLEPDPKIRAYRAMHAINNCLQRLTALSSNDPFNMAVVENDDDKEVARKIARFLSAIDDPKVRAFRSVVKRSDDDMTTSQIKMKKENLDLEDEDGIKEYFEQSLTCLLATNMVPILSVVGGQAGNDRDERQYAEKFARNFVGLCDSYEK